MGSLRVQTTTSSNWFLQTGNNLLAATTTYSMCFAAQFNSPTNIEYLMAKTGDACVLFSGSSPTQINCFVYSSGGGLHYYLTPVVGEVYFIAISFSPAGVTMYVNGEAVATGGSGTPSNTSPTSLQIGQAAPYAVDFSLAQMAFWDGYALTQANAISLRDGTLPSAISSGDLAAYWTLSGTLGATPTIGDAGLNDASGNGNNFLTQTGTPTLATYGGALVYTPPTLVTAYVTKSGQTACFFALSNATPSTVQAINTVSSNPTISVQFGGAGSPRVVQIQGPYLNNYTPFAIAQLSCGSVQSVVVQNGGSSYTSPSASVSGGGGSGCILGTPVLSSGVITSIPVTAGGSGYTSPPTITITDAHGSGAVAVPVMGGVQPSDVVTYSAADSWFTAASGPAPAAPSAYASAAVANHAGQLEPAIGGYLPFDLPANERTLKVGPQIVWPTQYNYFTANPCANWIHRANFGNVATATWDGHPLTITGTITGTFANPTQDNLINGQQYPTETGVWTFIADDTNPSGTMMTVGLVSGDSMATISPSGLNTPNISTGTLVGGVQVGRVWQFTVTRASTTNWNQELQIQIGGQSGTYNYTLQNECLFSPVDTYAALPGLPSRANALGPERSIVEWMTTPNRGSALMRFMGATADFQGYSSAIDADDLPNPAAFSWTYQNAPPGMLTGARTFTITTIRTYSITGSESWPAGWGAIGWHSPSVYLSAWNNAAGYAIDSVRINNTGASYALPTATVSGGGGTGCVLGTPVLSGGAITSIPVTSHGSGYITPPTITITDSTGSGAVAMPLAAVAPPSVNLGNWDGVYYVAEAVTSTPHYLKTGQLLTLISGTSTYTVSNGTGATATGTLQNYDEGTIAWVTSPTSFVFVGSMYPVPGTINPTTGLPGGVNNVVGSNTVDYTVTMELPLPGIIPWECAIKIVAAIPGCGIHVNIPAATSDACAAKIFALIRDGLPKGRKTYVEYSNENWNYGSTATYCNVMSVLGAWGTYGAGAGINSFAIRGAQHHRNAIAVFNQTDINGNTNRGNEVVCCHGSQFPNSSITLGVVEAVNAYNAAYPSAPFRIDRILVAPYLDVPGDAWVVSAAASLASGHTTSASYLSPTPWTRAAYLDWFRHWLKYNLYTSGPNSYYASHYGVLAGYNLVDGQAAPTLMGYEGGIEVIVPTGTETAADGSGHYLHNQLSLDVQFDPEAYHAETALLEQIQQGGMTEYEPFGMVMMPQGAESLSYPCYLWGLAAYSGQPAGRGDGTGTTTLGVVGSTDGVNPVGTLVTNKFWIDDGVCHQLDNVSVRMQATRDWMDANAAGIISITPGPLAVGVSASAVVTVVFAQAMDAGTITASTFTLSLGATAISGTVSYNSGTDTATFTPASPLAPGTYTIGLSSSITTSGGTPIAPASSSFQTIAVASPARWFPGLRRL